MISFRCCLLLATLLLFSCSQDPKSSSEPSTDDISQLDSMGNIMDDSIRANLEPPPAEKIPDDFVPAYKKDNEDSQTKEDETDNAATIEAVSDQKATEAIESSKAKSDKKKVAKKKSKPIIVFDEPTYNFGEITAGDVVDYKFHFTNTGDTPLEIREVKPSCGCTAPSFPFIPIQPGEKGYIGVRYNSVGKYGDQIADITVFSNAKDPAQKIFLKGLVNEKPKDEVQDSTSSN